MIQNLISGSISFIYRRNILGEEKLYCVYIHTFPNGKVYIGVTCRKPEHRWGSDGRGYTQCFRVYNAIQKYGWSNVEHEILFTGLSKIDAELKEIYLISEYKSMEAECGYNVSKGGQLNTTGISPSMETRRKLSISRMGNKNSLGCKQSQETIEKRRKKLIGHKVSAETRERISKSNTGMVRSKETSEKLSAALRGRIISPENCVKTGIRFSKPVVQSSKTGEIIKIWGSMESASKELGVWAAGISGCCRHINKSSGGFCWEYFNEENGEQTCH